MSGVLLDTCAAIWLVHDQPLHPDARRAVLEAGAAGKLFVSPVTAWEIGFLAYPAKGSPRMQFLPTPKAWYAELVGRPAIREAELTGDVAIEAAMLPGDFHRDPADRLMVATGRVKNLAIVTRDEKILGYAAAGHVRAVAC